MNEITQDKPSDERQQVSETRLTVGPKKSIEGKKVSKTFDLK
jgi:hypothetical protein